MDKDLIERMEKASEAIYIAAPEPVAEDISKLLKEAIEALQQKPLYFEVDLASGKDESIIIEAGSVKLVAEQKPVLPDVAVWWAVVYEGSPINMFDVKEFAHESAEALGSEYSVVEFIPKPLLKDYAIADGEPVWLCHTRSNALIYDGPIFETEKDCLDFWCGKNRDGGGAGRSDDVAVKYIPVQPIKEQE